jgi:hypothetical protein
MVASFAGKPCQAKCRVTVTSARLTQAPAAYNGQFAPIEDCEEVVVNRSSNPALFAICTSGAAEVAAAPLGPLVESGEDRSFHPRVG